MLSQVSQKVKDDVNENQLINQRTVTSSPSPIPIFSFNIFLTLLFFPFLLFGMFLGTRNWIEGAVSLSNLSGRGRRRGEGGGGGGFCSVLYSVQGPK